MINGTLYIDNFIDNDSFLFNTLRDNSEWDRRMASRLTTSFGVSYNYSDISYPDVIIPNYLDDLMVRINHKYQVFFQDERNLKANLH